MNQRILQPGQNFAQYEHSLNLESSDPHDCNVNNSYRKRLLE